MSIHIGAKPGDIAEIILLPGDPLRAKHVAETFLKDAVCYNEVRGMYGYTGFYNGVRVSVQGTGMGVPSISIYVNELIQTYGVQRLIRIGTAGAMREDVHVKDIILAQSASTTSGVNARKFNGADFAATANFECLLKAFQTAQHLGIPVKVGNVLTSDEFYEDDSEGYKKWAQYGTLCVEMETSALYTIAAKYGVKALSIFTISDSLVTHESTTSEERQLNFNDMVKIALGML